MERHQDVIIPAPKSADPILGELAPGISDQLRTLRRPLDERAE